MVQDSPLVSIIIPTWNNEESIRLCLESCIKQSYNQIEVIIVDGQSNDATVDICREFPVRIVQRDCGRAEARNIGFTFAEGTYVYHVDADMELTENVVETCVDYCERDGFDALLIPEENVGGGYWSNCLKFGKCINRREKQGNIRFLRSDLYAEVGGHNSDRLSGEDWDLHQRIQQQSDVQTGQINEVVFHHVEMMSLIKILEKRKDYAASQREIPEDERRSLEPYSNLKEYMKNIDMFISDPVHAIGYMMIEIINAGLVRYYRFMELRGYYQNE